jgi:hypothetical protein
MVKAKKTKPLALGGCYRRQGAGRPRRIDSDEHKAILDRGAGKYWSAAPGSDGHELALTETMKELDQAGFRFLWNPDGSPAENKRELVRTRFGTRPHAKQSRKPRVASSAAVPGQTAGFQTPVAGVSGTPRSAPPGVRQVGGADQGAVARGFLGDDSLDPLGGSDWESWESRDWDWG